MGILCCASSDRNDGLTKLASLTDRRVVFGISRLAVPLAGIVILLAAHSHAQSYLTTTGSPSFSTPQPVDLGFVDASNGNMHLSIPLGSYSQRGVDQLAKISLEYDSTFWTIAAPGGTAEWYPQPFPFEGTEGGWYLSNNGNSGTSGTSATKNCAEDDWWRDQNGTTRYFHLSTTGLTGCPSQASAYAADSSGYEMFVSSSAPNVLVYAPNGTLVYEYPVPKDSKGNYVLRKDTNGNYVSSSNPACNLIDTLGRQVATGCFYGSTYPITMLTSQGSATYTVTPVEIPVKTHFQQSGVAEYSGSPSLGNGVLVIESVTLPDAAGSTYHFIYDCDESSGISACGSPSGASAYYGELIGITLPTGGTVNYAYTTNSDAYGNKSQWVSSRTVAGGNWTYTPHVLTTCSSTQVNCQQQTTVVSPEGSTVYTFQLNNGAWPISVVQKDTQGNTLSTTTKTYDLSQSCVLINCNGASYVRLTSEQTTVPIPTGNLTKQTQYSYDNPQYGNQTAVKEWRFVTGGSFGSVPDRATYSTYLYTGTNDINKALSVTRCNNSGSSSYCPGGGSIIGQKLLSYDQYGSSGPVSIVGIAQHDDASFGTSYTTRGNVTSESNWVSGSTYLTTSYTYDMTGQVLSKIDPANNQTSFGYADSFYTDPGNNSTPASYTPTQPTNAYLTSVTDAVGTQRSSYYWGSGHASVGTDYNGAQITGHYQDGLDRKTEEIDPAGWKLASYSSATESDTYLGVGDTLPSTGCVSCQHFQTSLDGFGRTSSSSLMNTPLGVVSVNNTYDSAGRVATQSHLNTGGSDPNDVVETFGYDGLDRKISTTHPDGQTQWSAFGANVGILGGLSSPQGAPSTYGYGYPQITEDEAGHQKQQWMDGFGRIVEADEPTVTSSTPGTATVSIGSGSGQEWVTFNPCSPHGGNCPQTVPNSGTIFLTVGGYTASAPYGPTGQNTYESASQVASALASAFSNDPNSPVNAAASGDSILLSAKGPGSSTDFSFSSSATYDNGTCGSSPCFSGPVYVVSPSSGSLTGGAGGINSSPFYTNYTYDASDHLLSVVQGAEARTFQYDGLGRMISATNPESGTVTYSYNISGGGVCSGEPSNICQKTDARGVVSTYTYDHANRLTGVAYTIPGGHKIAAMPNVCTTIPNGTSANVCYYYDQGGSAAYALDRLTEVIDPTGSETTTYYNSGNVKQTSKVINGQTYNIGYQYNSGGDVTQITYPSGHVLYQSYNNVGQLCEIAPTANGCSGTGYYAGGFSYNPPGDLTGFTYGNGVVGSFGYSPNRDQLTSLNYIYGSQSLFNLGYWYQQNSLNCPNGTTSNNGDVQCIADIVSAGRTANFSYDALDRLITAKTNGSATYPQWGLSESYDRYGNRLSQTVTAGTGPSTSMSYNTNNQPTGFTFDSSGNMTVEPLSPPVNLTYDGENHMTAFSGNGGAATYVYDGNGLRVVKSIQGGATTVSVRSGSTVLDEYDNGAAPTSPSREYIYNNAGGATTKVLAMISSGSTTYYHQDHLSVRLTTNSSGNIVMQGGHYPFGEQWYQSISGNQWVFTNYQRDSESGLDYALARYYGSSLGRFLSPDRLGIASGNRANPQTLNLYLYALNNPLLNTDPSGMECVWDDGSYDSADDPETGDYYKCTNQGGTWIDTAIFESSIYYQGDWSGDPELLTSALVANIQGCQAAVGGGQAKNLLVADSITTGLNTAQTAYVLASADWESDMGKNMTEPSTSKDIPHYVGRLGNKSLADATTYRGRGYIQITGEKNYQKWSKFLGVDLVSNPSLASSPEIASQIAVFGSQWGAFTGKSLFNQPSFDDFIDDRDVVNANTTDKPTTRWNGPTYGMAIASDAINYYFKLQDGCTW